MPNYEERKNKADKMGGGLLGRAARKALSREEMINRMADNPYGFQEVRKKDNVKTTEGGK